MSTEAPVQAPLSAKEIDPTVKEPMQQIPAGEMRQNG